MFATRALWPFTRWPGRRIVEKVVPGNERLCPPEGKRRPRNRAGRTPGGISGHGTTDPCEVKCHPPSRCARLFRNWFLIERRDDLAAQS